MKKTITWILSLLFTVVLLWAVFRQVDAPEVWRSLQQVRPGYLAAALLISFATNCWLATLKWRLIIRRFGLPLPFGEAFMLKMSSGLIKSVLPFRSGEASRVVYLKRVHGFSITQSTASILIELVSNILIFALIITAGWILFPVQPFGIAVVAVGLLALSVLSLAAAVHPGVQRLPQLLANHVPWERVRGGLRALGSIHRFLSYGDLALVLAYSLMIQAGKLGTFFLINSALGIRLPAAAYFVILPFSVLISTVPITFLGMGLRECTLTEMVQACSPVDPAILLGSALLFSVVEYIFPALLGIFWTGRFFARMVSGKGPGGTEG